MTETTTNPYAAGLESTRVLIENLINEANEDARVVKSAQNQGSLITDLIKDSDDEMVQKYREQKEKAEAALANWEREITAYVKANLLPKDDNAADVEAATGRYQEKTAAIKGFIGALKVLPGHEEILASLPELTKVGRAGGVNQTGTKRPRVERITVTDGDNSTEVSDVKVDPKTKDETTVVSFTVLSQYLKKTYGVKFDAATLREHAEGTAGSSDTWSNAFTFALSLDQGEGNPSKNLMVEVVPQSKD